MHIQHQRPEEWVGILQKSQIVPEGEVQELTFGEKGSLRNQILGRRVQSKAL